jgi:hypothetical protein
MGTDWAPAGAGAKYGLGQGLRGETTELTAVPTPGLAAAAAAKPWSPDSPLFWFGAIAALTFGLMAVSTSVRVGPAKASLNLGT